MPRLKRDGLAGQICHALKRGNMRQTIFRKDADYEAFLRVLTDGREKYSVDIFSFSLMQVVRTSSCVPITMGRWGDFSAGAPQPIHYVTTHTITLAALGICIKPDSRAFRFKMTHTST